MLLAGEIFASSGAETVIACLTPYGSTEGSLRFPATRRDTAELRVSGTESPHQWFQRVIGRRDVEARVGECSVEDNFAFFGEVEWKAGVLRECHFQALITDAPNLRTFHSATNASARDYRYEFDLAKPGPLLAEPQPHIHCAPEGPPRFPLASKAGEYCLISFLEFVYRNHFPKKWFHWVKSVSNEGITDAQLGSLIAAFDSGSIGQNLRELKPHLRRLKSVLSKHKRNRVPDAHPLPVECYALTYP
jgi:hypothetical protein